MSTRISNCGILAWFFLLSLDKYKNLTKELCMNFSNRQSLRTRMLALSVALFFAGGLAVCAADGDKTKEEKGASASSVKNAKAKNSASLKPQTTCPVMEGEINKSLYADVKGYRIYVCCSGCINEIKKDPDKYIKKLQDMGVEIEKAPEKTKVAK